MDAKVVKLFGEDRLIQDLHIDLHNIIVSDKYEGLYNGSIVGILEYLKWNLINAS